MSHPIARALAALAIAVSVAAVPTVAGAVNLTAQETTRAAPSDPRHRTLSPQGREARRAALARGNHQTSRGFINLSGRYEPKFNITGRRVRSLLRY